MLGKTTRRTKAPNKKPARSKNTRLLLSAGETARIKLHVKHTNLLATLNESLSLSLKRYVLMQGGQKRDALKEKIKQIIMKSISRKMRGNQTQLTLFQNFLQTQLSGLEKTRFIQETAKMKALLDIYSECFH